MTRSAIAAALLFACAPTFATTYSLEPNYTQAVVQWNHLGFSTPSATLGQGTGTIEFDQADPTKSSIAITIPLSSLNTSVPELDEHLRSADFFDATKFPTAAFVSTKIEKNGAANHFNVTGDLALHGVTKPVTLAVTLVRIGVNPRSNLPTIGFVASTTLTRSEFGLGKFVPQVSDAIPLHVIAQAVDAKALADYEKAEAEAEKTSTAKKE
ncbi:MAG TPA: YceI family protein [Rudaea sp.]|jgi:polyisoprenoid-binding protein YceI|nr:YceI family protein [Rudaea sp.]